MGLFRSTPVRPTLTIQIISLNWCYHKIMQPLPIKEKKPLSNRVYLLGLLLILLASAYFRTVGIYWGEEQYLHPDERFLVWVGSDISPVHSFSEYFNTTISSLNPHNRGHGFFVYGTLPMFTTRYLVEWIIGHSGFQEMLQVGRPLSALADLLTVLLVAATAHHLYGKKVSLLAAAFYGMAVLPIQLSHFFKEDTFLNMFIFLGIYLAIRIADIPEPNSEIQDTTDPPVNSAGFWKSWFKSPLFLLNIAFGLSFGCALSSKITAYPLAFVLPAAFIIRYFNIHFTDKDEYARQLFIKKAICYLILGGFISILTFRIFQPYAFKGPGFFGVLPNPAWVENIKEQRNQSTGDVDFPPALQWARRSFTFSGKNLTLWGLGLPLGLLAWAGFIWMGWRSLRGDWRKHAIVWGWTAFYFIWQSFQPNPTMRYQLPSYPGLAIMAAWLIIWLYQFKPDAANSPTVYLDSQPEKPARQPFLLRLRSFWNSKAATWTSWILAILVLSLTATWAYAFTRIYTRPVTRIAASRWIYQNVPGPINVQIQSPSAASYNQPLSFPYGDAITATHPYQTTFEAHLTGNITQVSLGHALDVTNLRTDKTLLLTLSKSAQPDFSIQLKLTSDFLPISDERGESFTIPLPNPFPVNQGEQYQLVLSIENTQAAIALSGASPANESSWDDGLPLRMDGYDGYGGIYTPDLVFEMYWDDNPEKLDRFLSTLDQSDYIFISSNRQWATVPRIPERYPLSTTYYRHLIGCPDEKDVIWCYNVAKPGQFQGDLGFDLVQVFESFPSIGKLQINDQFAEEAFTVYDHPKVLIFKKSTNYDQTRVQQILGAVDLNMVVHLTPRQAGKVPGLLMLPPDRWKEQQTGGTWCELFNMQSLINRNPFVSGLVWYLTLTLLGWVVYPIVRQIFRGLPDRGFPLARIFGLLLLSYLVWLFGSFRVPFTRLTISLSASAIVLVSIALAILNYDEIKREIQQHKKVILWIELFTLGFFLLDLFIRIGNPDLWHPWKGGEKPMDFAYFNAILKSTSFPPYDPWYAGGYLNYYYYGFVLFGVPVKWLGIMPSVAYNLILPTIFSLIAMGAFSLGWNLVAYFSPSEHGNHSPSPYPKMIAAISSALGMAVLGNLGTVRMILVGYQKLAAPGGIVEGTNLFSRILWTFLGFIQAIKGMNLPYSLGDWYWIPSRAIPAPNDVEPITEFPFFTILYGDPHAHLFALPLALLSLSIALSFVLMKKCRWNWKTFIQLLFAGLIVGALRPTNYSDYYPYLLIMCISVGYSFWTTYYREKPLTQTIAYTVLAIGTVSAASTIFYQPFLHWLGWGYTKLSIWQGTHTPSTSYFVHWGLFLFILISWFVWETIDWMAHTPLTSLKKLAPYKAWIGYGLLLVLLIILVLKFWLQIEITWIVLPLAVWDGILLLRPDQSPPKRYVFLIVGFSLLLTLMVETIVVAGDIGRMNTVFKFYLQAWTMLAISAGAALGWILPALARWISGWRKVWMGALAILVFSASLYPLTAATAKIKDRMTDSAPHTLDGMAYMAYAKYADSWGEMDLNQDYQAILWMLNHVKGSPVIVEANLRDLYRWGSRFSIYTGLPGVVGWEWHQQQQRTLFPSAWVSNRIDEIENFYRTTDLMSAANFLRKYQVRYIIVGQQERGKYPGPGLEKFDAANGLLWTAVYRNQQTVIYEVNLP